MNKSKTSNSMYLISSLIFIYIITIDCSENLKNMIDQNYLNYQNLTYSYKTLSNNLESQKKIIEKLQNLINEHKEEFNTIKNKIEESENINKDAIDKINNNLNQISEDANKNLTKVDDFKSEFCNENKECVKIIDIERNFMGNLVQNKKNVNILKNDIFNVINFGDILQNKYNSGAYQEFIVDFILIDFKNIITKNSALFINTVFKKRNFQNKRYSYFVLVITNKSILILNADYKIIEKFNLKTKSNIIKADFSFFEEDNNLIYVTEDYNIYSIALDIYYVKLAHQMDIIEEFDDKGEKIKFENSIIYIPLKKTSTINIKNKLVFLGQHQLHSNKYVIIGLEKGTILVLNKDLDMRLSFTLSKDINSIFVNNGIIGVVSGRTVDFFNMLGGNSILITCFGSFPITGAVMDNLNNLLITYDEGHHLLFFSLKLSISRVNNNECYPIYKLRIFKDDVDTQKVKFNEDHNIKDYFYSIRKNIKMEIFKNILILLKNNKYMMIVDLNFSHKNAEIQHVVYYREFLTNFKLKKNKMNLTDDIYNNALRRTEYFSDLNSDTFKINMINRHEIIIIGKISDFDLYITNFSIENFSKDNAFYSKEYFNDQKTSFNFTEVLKNSEFNPSLFRKNDMSESNFINLKLFNLNFTKIKDILFDQEDKYELYLRQINESIENNKFKNNLYYKILSGNIESIILYPLVIVILIIFSFFLRIYYNKKQEEKRILYREKIKQLENLNINQIKGKSDIILNDEKLLSQNNRNEAENKPKLIDKEKEMKKIISIIKDNNNNKDEEQKIKNYVMNNKNFTSSDEGEFNEYSNQRNFNQDLGNARANIKNFINREKKNLNIDKKRNSKKLEDEGYRS